MLVAFGGLVLSGCGAMEIKSDTDFQNKKLDRTVPLTIVWDKSMLFDGRFAEFHGDPTKSGLTPTPKEGEAGKTNRVTPLRTDLAERMRAAVQSALGVSLEQELKVW